MRGFDPGKASAVLHPAKQSILAMCVGAVATAGLITALSFPFLPVSARAVGAALGIALALMPIGLAIRYWPQAEGGTHAQQARNRFFISMLWLANAAGLAIGLVAFPHVGIEVKLVHFLLATVLIGCNALATVAIPGWGHGGRMAWAMPATPLLMAFALALWTPDPAFFAALGAMAVGLLLLMANRHFLQTQTNAMLGALRAAEAERDARKLASERFLASASHDMEQPLQAARLSLDHLLASTDDAVRARAVERIDLAFGAVEDMARQITGHLQLEAGIVKPVIRPLDLAGTLARAVALAEPMARVAGIDIRVVKTSCWVLGDAVLVDRILGNLIGNAIKHSGGTRVLIGVRRAGNHARIWVIDNGGGIPQALHETLFEDFIQGDHGDSIRGGFGLGLGSARRMAVLMEGSVTYHPGLGRGAGFLLELPLL